MFFNRDLPCELLVSPTLEFVIVGLVDRLVYVVSKKGYQIGVLANYPVIIEWWVL